MSSPSGADYGETVGSEEPLVRARFRSSVGILGRPATVTISSDRLVAAWPRLRFGVIPVGAAQLAVPIPAVTYLSAPLGVDTATAIAGFIATVIGGLGWLPTSSPLLAVVLIILGLGVMATAPRQLIRITSQSATHDVPVSIFERPRVMAFVKEGTAALSSIRQGN